MSRLSAMTAPAPPGPRSLAMVVNRWARSASRSFMAGQGRGDYVQEQDWLSLGIQVIINNVDGSGVNCQIELPGGTRYQFGDTPDVRIKFHDNHILSRTLDEMSFAEAYINGVIDIDGDIRAVLKLLRHIRGRLPFRVWLKFLFDLLRPGTVVDRIAVRNHYHHDDDFYLFFRTGNTIVIPMASTTMHTNPSKRERSIR